VLGTRFFLSNLCLSGSLHRRKSCCREMVSTSRLEMEKFNGTNFELWKLKMEDLLIDRDLWVAVSRTKPIGMKDEEWVVLERKERSLIRLCLADSVLLNVSEEKTATTLWKKLGDLYQAKSLVNKLFFM
jgi:hypothetical protein